MNKVKKAVFPVGGMGTRFLPATKSTPKEMLPIVDKPLIQYAVEEAAHAGIEQMIFVTGRGKRAIEDHFDKAYELENELTRSGKVEILETLRQSLPRSISYMYIRQSEPLGLGHAVLSAAPIIGDEPFAVLLADDFLPQDAKHNFMGRMIEKFNLHQSSILCTREVDIDDAGSYGVVATDENLKLQAIIEKPEKGRAPSNRVVVGRYVFTNHLFQCLRGLKPGRNGEIQLTDAISKLIGNEDIFTLPLEGKYFDCGNRIDYCLANFALAAEHAEFGESFKQKCREILENQM